MSLNKINALFSLATLLFIMIWSTPAHPQKPTINHTNVHPLHIEGNYNNDQTLASLRDNEGFLWIATDNGLKRYDGYNLQTYVEDKNNPSSIKSNNITSLLLQESGDLWAAGDTLNLFHPETETFSSFNISNNLAINALHDDNSGTLWAAGEGFGLIAFDISKKKVTHSFFTKDSTRFITSITQKKHSPILWISTNTGLYSFNTKTHKASLFQLPLDYNITKNTIRATTEDNNGNLWLATHQGLIVLNPKTKNHKKYQSLPNSPGALKSNLLQSIFMDSQGEIWIGTDKKGVHKYLASTDSFMHYPSYPSSNLRFPSAPINHIYEDAEKTLWFSVGGSGIYRITEHLEKFRTFQHIQDGTKKNMKGLIYNNISDLLEDKNGMIWIATDGGGLSRYNPHSQNFSHYQHNPQDPNSLSSNDTLSLAEDQEGDIWIGTWGGGLNRLDPDTGIFTQIRYDKQKGKTQTLSNNSILRIEASNDGKLYLSLWSKGLQIYDPEKHTFESYIPFESPSTNHISNMVIHDILMNDKGKYWIAGNSGLEVFDPTTKTFTKINITDAEIIHDIHQDRNGVLWLANSKSLIQYHPTTNIVKTYTTASGLIDNFVVSIEEDIAGNLWLGTRRGLSRFSPKTEEFTNFTEKDGLVSSQFNPYSHLKTQNGYMYFGGKNGLNVFQPSHLPTNNTVPKIHLTNFEIFQTPITPGAFPWFDHHINLIQELTLPHSKKNILFEFTALNYISPTKNNYKYRLKGLEEDWIYATSAQRRVRYTNLASGSYTFQVLGSNNEGLWNGTAKELKLTILPAWWQTWWAIILYILMLATAIYSFSFWRLRLTRSHQWELKEIVKQKTMELKEANRAVNQLNSELEQRVSHRTKELSHEIEVRRHAEERSSHLAFHDPLTELPNRSWLLQHLEKLISQTQSTDFQFALFFIGGDRFKQINDTHGHLLGDMLLVAAAKRLRQILPDHYHTVRLGSDEFTIVMDEIESEEQVILIAEKLLQCFKKPFVFEQAKMNFNVSIGMLICSNEYTHPTQILRNVDIAMNYAKSRGRGMYQMFDNDILRQTLESTSLQADLQQALKLNQFEVVYQPIVLLETGVLSGFETLLRWNHPKRGMVPPDTFITVAEELGIIFDIGLWVLKQACQQLLSWQLEMGTKTLPTVAVNLSPLQLKQADLLHKFDSIFSEMGILRKKVKLEITESALMENTGTTEQLLEGLRERGIELAIDDFGTGYSSLSYLDKLPVQVLKIDQSFVSSLFEEGDKTEGPHEIVRATIALAHNLKMRVVAEGIETQAQMDVLKSYKCDYGQGYFIARPLSPKAATDFLLQSK